MQVTSASAATNPPPRDVLAGEPGSAMPSSAPPFRPVQGDPPQRRGGRLRAGEDRDRDDQGVPRRQRRAGRGVGARARAGRRKLTDAVVAALMQRKPDGGTIHIEEIQDQVELALMRGGEHEVARAYVLYREKRSQERAHEKHAGAAASRRSRDQRASTTASRSRSTSSALTRAGQGVVRRPGRRRARAHPQGDAEGPVRRRADGRGAQVGDAGGARADREGSGLQPTSPRACCSTRMRLEALGEEATQAEMATRYAEYFPQFIKHGIEDRPARTKRSRSST